MTMTVLPPPSGDADSRVDGYVVLQDAYDVARQPMAERVRPNLRDETVIASVREHRSAWCAAATGRRDTVDGEPAGARERADLGACSPSVLAGTSVSGR